ncbi:hypothetical protein [Streptomyces hokutonensis]|uniref:hypothetical protein n=1 Tax=Streptomyces hokutonensis TaxID=1306990 RepID=UPI0033EC67E2
MSETHRQILLDDTLTEFMASHIDRTKQVASHWGGIHHKSWSAVTKHRTPWVATGSQFAFDDDGWELYDGSTDPSQAHDLAAEMPGKLRELQRLWLIEATRYNVLPMDDRTAERFNAEIPQVEAERPLPSGEHQVRHGTPVTRPARAMTPYQGEGSWAIRC